TLLGVPYTSTIIDVSREDSPFVSEQGTQKIYTEVNEYSARPADDTQSLADKMIERKKGKSVLKTKRVYEPAASTDGTRFLVDRLWPRGIKKESLKMKAWLKEV